MEQYHLKDQLTQTEISERIAVLHRFKVLLMQQRNKFAEYLQVLEAQENSIASEDVDKIVEHSQLGQSLISEISMIQKVIVPIENLYKDIRTKSPDFSHSAFRDEVNETEHIQKDLQRLKATVLEQNQKNAERLKNHMSGLRQQIADLKLRRTATSPFSSDDTASLIDINA